MERTMRSCRNRACSKRCALFVNWIFFPGTKCWRSIRRIAFSGVSSTVCKSKLSSRLTPFHAIRKLCGDSLLASVFHPVNDSLRHCKKRCIVCAPFLNGLFPKRMRNRPKLIWEFSATKSGRPRRSRIWRKDLPASISRRGLAKYSASYARFCSNGSGKRQIQMQLSINWFASLKSTARAVCSSNFSSRIPDCSNC